MLDSVNWEAIAAAIRERRTWRNLTIKAAAGYIDGPRSQWPDEAWGALDALGVLVARISVTGIPGATYYDCETGDLTPANVAEVLHAEHEAGRFAGAYVNRSNKPTVVNICGHDYGLRLGRDYGLIVATLDNSFTDLDGTDLRHEPGVLAVQYLGAQAAGVDADVNLLIADWPAPGWLQEAYRLAGHIGATTGELLGVLGRHD